MSNALVFNNTTTKSAKDILHGRNLTQKKVDCGLYANQDHEMCIGVLGVVPFKIQIL